MKTALQELFSKLETEYPNLFNIHTVEGREFINKCYPFLELEKQQIQDAFYRGKQEALLNSMSVSLYTETNPEEFYNKKYGIK